MRFALALILLLLVVTIPRVSSGEPASGTPLGSRVYDVPIGDSAVRGPKDGPVTIVVFGDFHCPYTRQLMSMLPQVLAERPSDVALVMKQFPLSLIHPYAEQAARLAIAAGTHGKFWEMADQLLAAPKELSPATISALAAAIQLDPAVLQQDATSTTVTRAVAAEQALGHAVQVRGTPSIFVNGRILTNRSPEGFRAAIDSLLAARGASAAPAPGATAQPDVGAARAGESTTSLRTDPAPVAQFDVLGITLRSKASDIHHQFRPNDPLPTPDPGRKPVPSNYRGTFGQIETYFTDADELVCLSRTQQFREGSQATFSRTRDALLAKYGPPNSFVQERNDHGEVKASHFVWIAEPALLANSNCVHIHSAAPEVPRDGALVSGCAFLKVSLHTEPVADTLVVTSITTFLASHDVSLEQAARRRDVRDEKALEKKRDAENTAPPTF